MVLKFSLIEQSTQNALMALHIIRRMIPSGLQVSIGPFFGKLN